MNGQNFATYLKDSDGRVLDGPCVRCAHCGLGLTDSVSIQRGIGPICSRKGYHDDPVDGDDGQAMAILGADYPELVDHLVKTYYEPNGARGFMNGLVRVASLNRGDVKLHETISLAVEALGWKKLADALRESLAVVEIKKVGKPDVTHYRVKVKRRAYKSQYSEMMRKIPGAKFAYVGKEWTVPAEQKAALWNVLTECFDGQCGRVIGESGFRIVRKK